MVNNSMAKDKIKKKSTEKKKTSQLRLTQLTCYPRYEVGITQQKGKQNISQNSRLNNSMSNDENENEKKIIFKNKFKKDRT
jgi:hypothetical protein